MTAEDKIHVALLAAVAAASAALFGGQRPLAPEHAPAPALSARAPAPPLEVRREELDATIAALKDSIEERYGRSENPRELALAVGALGRGALGAELERGLGRLAEGWPSELTRRAASLASVSGASPPQPGPESPLSSAESLPMAVLGTLLEAGIPLEQQVPLPTGSTTISALVRAALALPAPASSEARALRLDLTTFAALGGLEAEAAKLPQLTYETLRRLEAGYREWNAEHDAALDPATLARLGAPFRAGGELEPSAAELQASAAVFRAVAVLAEPDLDEAARRHLGALSHRYRIERALYAHLLTEAEAPPARERVHLTAVERLGRLQQALYQAHLSQRTEQRRSPTPELAKLMRQVAGELLDHLREVRGSVLADAAGASANDREARLRAAVHALRGLRTARVAI